MDATYLKNVLLQAFESGGAQQAAGGRGVARCCALCVGSAMLAAGSATVGHGTRTPDRGACLCLSDQPAFPTWRPAGELPANSTMVPILARLLEFSPSELRRVQDKAAAAGGAAGAAALFAGMPAFKLPQLPGLPGLPGSK